MERSMKVRAEVVGWSLLPGYGGLPGLHTDEKGSLRGFAEADHIIHHQLRLYPQIVFDLPSTSVSEAVPQKEKATYRKELPH